MLLMVGEDPLPGWTQILQTQWVGAVIGDVDLDPHLAASLQADVLAFMESHTFRLAGPKQTDELLSQQFFPLSIDANHEVFREELGTKVAIDGLLVSGISVRKVTAQTVVAVAEVHDESTILKSNFGEEDLGNRLHPVELEGILPREEGLRKGFIHFEVEGVVTRFEPRFTATHEHLFLTVLELEFRLEGGEWLEGFDLSPGHHGVLEHRLAL